MDDIQGIRKIEINYITNIIIVEFDTALITKQKVRNRLINSRCEFVTIGVEF